jgi:hypothetical protein
LHNCEWLIGASSRPGMVAAVTARLLPDDLEANPK